MKPFLSLIALLLASTSLEAAVPELIPGCQGEGCDCFHEYRSDTLGAGPKDHDIPAIRSFTVFKDRSRAAQLLGKFASGTRARPLRQDFIVEVTGEYIVDLVKDKKLPLRKGDRIDTLINEGEGFARGRLNGKWVNFDFENVKLKVVKETVTSEWMSVKVNGITGFTQDQPFQMCLE